MQLNLDITQYRNDKSQITNTDSVFLCLLHAAGTIVRKAHHAQRSQHASSVPPVSHLPPPP